MSTSLAADPDALRAALTDPWRVVAALRLTWGASGEGKGVKVSCPWCHRGRNSSPCMLTVQDGQLDVHCFGCHRGGDVLALIAQVEEIDPQREQARLLARARELATLAARLVAPDPAALRAAAPRGKPALGAAAWDRGVRGLLGLCPLRGSVAAELASQGILAEALADGWGELPANLSKQGDERARDAAEGFDVDAPELDEMMAALSDRALRAFVPWLWTPLGAVDRPSHRQLIPWRGPDGRIWTLQRRWAPVHGHEPPPANEPRWLEPLGTAASPAGPHPYGIEAPGRATATEVWLAEGAHDTLALRALNRRGLLRRDQQPRPLLALGLPAVGAWGRVRDELLPLVAGKRVVVAPKRHHVADTATSQIADDCRGAGSTVAVKAPPHGAPDWVAVAAWGAERKAG